jgi:DNA-binding transcriptional LysR family regulator
MIDLRHVRHLLAVATHPTVQSAADSLYLTQPALTKSIARFEDELDAKLFDRRGRTLVLTELGQRLVERGEDLMRHVRELEEEVSLWQGIGTGEVTIGVDPETELSMLPSVLKRFVPAHPGVQVIVRSGHTEILLPALLNGDLHFLVADPELALARNDLEIQRLAADPLAVALRPDHPLARTRKPTPLDLKAHPLAGASTAPRFGQWSAQRAHQEGAEAFVQALVCDNYEVLVRLAEETDTIVFGPRSLLATYETAGRLKVMSWPLEGPESSPSLIRTKGRQLSPAAEKLMGLFGD